ncbi:N-acetylmuramoyl-L-alanine amidase [Sebaldella sp. S0638]|uniref:N-acetylmuramoyl-L-alanine amidase n=1 Tax=Sebaldella sp. S0638 TaxID=2957809 RepID=UPI00209D14F3|nr:N-acetylmuramoyl-L-alanine amidase [Sebaldella sp. S0638]MCP1225464.1 N-acetylmuramoyl-L-alanine amidase [Sebaldella sp. S0638]
MKAALKRAILLLNILLILAGCTSVTEKGNRVINTKMGSERVDGITYTSKGQNFRQRFIILHYTVSDRERSIDLLANKDVSSHYLITDRENEPIYYLVDENKRAWHAGISSWGSFSNLNDNSIGIEIVNKGFVMKDGKMNFYQFPSWQIHKTAVLLLDLIKRYEIEPQNILGHSDIAPQRKQDPGPLFPWKELYRDYGIGMWYDDTVKEKYKNAFSEGVTPEDVQKELKKFGYGIVVTKEYDEQTKNVITAFQFHFIQYKYDGVMDAETYAVLKALNEKYKK